MVLFVSSLAPTAKLQFLLCPPPQDYDGPSEQIVSVSDSGNCQYQVLVTKCCRGWIRIFVHLCDRWGVRLFVLYCYNVVDQVMQLYVFTSQYHQ